MFLNKTVTAKRTLLFLAMVNLIAVNILPNASAIRQVTDNIVHDGIFTQFALRKTLDITNLGVNLTISNGERQNLMAQAERDSEDWYVANDWVNNYFIDEENILDESGLHKFLESKTNEFYNNRLADLFKQKLGNQLDGYKFNFKLVEISEAEANNYGIDGSTVKRGTVRQGYDSIPFSTVDFGGDDQLYDEALNNYIKEYTGLQREYYETDSEASVFDEKRLADDRDLMTHTVLFDKGRASGSDLGFFNYSSINYGVEKGNAGYPGFRCLISFCHSFNVYEYEVSSFLIPKVFNFHLNPGSLYVTEEAQADLIVDAKFDANGKLTQISKSLLPVLGNIDDLQSAYEGYRKNVRENMEAYSGITEDGRYRYKLVEEPTTIGDMTFNNQDEYIVDVIFKKDGVSYVGNDGSNREIKFDLYDTRFYKDVDSIERQDAVLTPGAAAFSNVNYERVELINDTVPSFYNKGVKNEEPPKEETKPVETPKEVRSESTTNNPNTGNRKILPMVIAGASAMILLSALAVSRCKRR